MRGRRLLVASVVVAIVVTVVATAVLVLVDPRAPKAEALRTGGLTGGAVVALYALWLNDRRRRTEEARHELEGDRVADERFARAVELLGNPADQVRVGALHALAQHAETVPRYRQTVLDVFCAYLRMPFDADEAGEYDARERQVRLTAQRLITDLLPWGQSTDPRRYHLDLTGAVLEGLRLEGRRVGRIVARDAVLLGITRLGGLLATKPVLFSGAEFHGRVDLSGAELMGGLSLSRTTFDDDLNLTDATVATFANLQAAAPALLIGALRVADGAQVEGDAGPWTLAGADGPAADER